MDPHISRTNYACCDFKGEAQHPEHWTVAQRGTFRIHIRTNIEDKKHLIIANISLLNKQSKTMNLKWLSTLKFRKILGDREPIRGPSCSKISCAPKADHQ